jgi:hypothetical protein
MARRWSQGWPAGCRPGVAITGGLAGDGSRFRHTWVLAGGTPAAGIVRPSAVRRPPAVGSGCEGGWMDFGPERRITRSAGNVLYELDGKPALDLYKTYLGERPQGLPGSALLFPLSIRRPEGDGPAAGAHHPGHRRGRAVDDLCRRHARGPSRA